VIKKISKKPFPGKPLSADSAREKGWHELKYWKGRKAAEGELSNDHYGQFYTCHFGIDANFYSGKRVLDIGCGPRGSLEWANMAAERVGLDPLADEYVKLGARNHKMSYVTAPSEKIPFSNDHFDVVCSFNSLDHVDDLPAAVREIVRVLRPGGLFLLLTEVNHAPTNCEPQVFSWDIVKMFAPHLELIEERRYERKAQGMYQSISQNIPYDFKNPKKRYGILSAKFSKR
jgi:ubiquinone/menaquinone biosynthesis C-methylase UbiE